MKTVVIYKTTSGFTKRYSDWIAEGLKADIFPHSGTTLEKLLGYDLIIYGGSLHATGVSGVDLIKKNLPKLLGKNIIVFATGASPYSKRVEEEVRDRNFTAEEQKRLRFFYLRGGYDHSKLDLKNRLLMDLLRFKILMRPKGKRTPDEVGMLAAFKHPMDAARKENLKALLEYARSGSQRSRSLLSFSGKRC